MPEFDIAFDQTRIYTIKESKDNSSGPRFGPEKDYYPGIILKLVLARHPIQAIFNFWLPTVVLSAFVAASTMIKEIQDTIAACGIATLTYI